METTLYLGFKAWGLGFYRVYIGIMDKEMETTLCLGFRVWGVGFL